MDLIESDDLDFEVLLEELQCDEICSISDCTSNECISLHPYEGKRKRHRIRKRRPVCSGPVIVKHDIRRSYLNMIINVFNTGDFALLYGFMDTFLAPNAQTSFHKTVEGVIRREFTSSFTGTFQAAQQWCNSLVTHPDAIFSALGYSLEYGTGRVVGKINFAGTNVFDNASVREALILGAADSEDCSDTKRRSSDSWSHCIIVKKITENSNKVASKLVPRRGMEQYSVTGTYIFCTDNDRRITSMELLVDC